jgi:hypothetical protein
MIPLKSLAGGKVTDKTSLVSLLETYTIPPFGFLHSSVSSISRTALLDLLLLNDSSMTRQCLLFGFGL